MPSSTGSRPRTTGRSFWPHLESRPQEREALWLVLARLGKRKGGYSLPGFLFTPGGVPASPGAPSTRCWPGCPWPFCCCFPSSLAGWGRAVPGRLVRERDSVLPGQAPDSGGPGRPGGLSLSCSPPAGSWKTPSPSLFCGRSWAPPSPPSAPAGPGGGDGGLRRGGLGAVPGVFPAAHPPGPAAVPPVPKADGGLSRSAAGIVRGCGPGGSGHCRPFVPGHSAPVVPSGILRGKRLCVHRPVSPPAPGPGREQRPVHQGRAPHRFQRLGKSTFLKALAVNAILGQSLLTCAAKGCRFRPGPVLTSMAVRDDISAGESYFMAEVRSLIRLTDAARQGRCLLLIDEILPGHQHRGAPGRQPGGLGGAPPPGLPLRGRHPRPGAHWAAGGRVSQLPLQETLTEEGVQFDYALRKAPPTPKNAIRLLGLLGCAPGTVRRAEELAKQGEETP